MHFVSPKAPGGVVKLRAQVPKDVSFGDLYTFAFEGEDPAHPIQASGNRVSVPRDTPGKYVVKVMVKPPAPAGGGAAPAPTQEVTRLNVWVVWATITSSPRPIQPAEFADKLALQGGLVFAHNIFPESITALGNDIPDLRGSARAPAGYGPCGDDLSNGADLKWDASQRRRIRVVAPAWLAPRCLDRPASYPLDPIVGNDDADVSDEDNRPYINNGILTSIDTPRQTALNNQGAVGDTIEYHMQFQQFTRLYIQGTWYVISDPYPWKAYFKFRKKVMNDEGTSPRWVDDGSSIQLNNNDF